MRSCTLPPGKGSDSSLWNRERTVSSCRSDSPEGSQGESLGAPAEFGGACLAGRPTTIPSTDSPESKSEHQRHSVHRCGWAGFASFAGWNAVGRRAKLAKDRPHDGAARSALQSIRGPPALSMVLHGRPGSYTVARLPGMGELLLGQRAGKRCGACDSAAAQRDDLGGRRWRPDAR